MEDATCAETGVCKLHGVETERRKHVAELANHVPSILTWINFMKGYMVFLTMILTGGFIYSFNIDADAKFRDDQFNLRMTSYSAARTVDDSSRYRDIDTKLAQLATQTALNEQRYRNVIEDLKGLSQDLRELLKQDRIQNETKIQKSSQ
jgi:hypothetical protein